MSNTLCSFCDRASFEHQIVTENEAFYLIHSRRPLARGHCLVIPKKHLPEGIGIEQDTGKDFIAISNKAFSAVMQAFGAAGINFFANFGSLAGQEIPHTHFHVVPRYPDEAASPFQKLNQPDAQKDQQRMDPALMKSEIEALRKFL